MTTASPPAGPSAPAARIPWGALGLVILLVGLAGAGVVVLLRPHIEFTNELAGPVRLVVGNGAPRTVLPGGQVRLAVARGATSVAQWGLIRPLSADKQPMGSEVRGSAVLRDPTGTTQVRATSRTADQAYFAPHITNATAQALRVLVNAGLQGAIDCGCAVRPGGRRVYIGYYPLFRNSTVRARGPGNTSAEFQDLGAQVTRADGVVGLRFEDKDLRAP
jgi:hypothetical protein